MSSDITELTSYVYPNLSLISRDVKNRDDLFALIIAIKKLPTKNLNTWLSESGPMTLDPIELDKYKNVFIRGIKEVERFFQSEGVLP